MRTHRPPSACPVCSDALITLRLGCPTCGTEVSGHFETCRFCRLDASDSEILEVFLRGRGNVRDVQAHLQVSYPTARARLTEVLERLGLAPAEPAGPSLGGPYPGGPYPGGPSSAGPLSAGSVLADLAAGRITVDEAESRLRGGVPAGDDSQ